MIIPCIVTRSGLISKPLLHRNCIEFWRQIRGRSNSEQSYKISWDQWVRTCDSNARGRRAWRKPAVNGQCPRSVMQCGEPRKKRGDSPAAGTSLVLLGQVALKRLEVLEHWTRIHFTGPRDRLESIGPRLTCAHRQHGLKLGPGLLAAVDRTGVQGPLMASGVTQGLV